MRALGSVLFLSSAMALAQSVDIPLTNWTVPPYRSGSSGLSTMGDGIPAVAFIGLAPCRLLDTRNNLNPLGGGGPFAVNETRNYTLPPNCGVPVGTDAVSLNVTATNTSAGAFGHIKIWPQGSAEPNVSTLNYPGPGATVANAAIVPLSISGGLSVKSGNAGADVILDVNGYFTDLYPPGVTFSAVSGTVVPAIQGVNTSGAGGAVGVEGTIGPSNSAPAAAGVRGINNGTGAGGVGVWGSQSGSGWGVFGETPSGVGVYGQATATTGANYGMRAETSSQAQNSAGIRANNGAGALAANFFTSGVRGEAGVGGIGVLGVTRGWAGVSGYHIGTGAAILSGSDLGYTPTVGLNVTGNAQVFGSFSATTNKGFIQPHPHDASKEIRYIALEGPYTDLYFRGTAQVSQGVTRIPIPQHFRWVTDPATYSTLVTPVGDMATVAVVSEGPEGIVVRASRNVKVHYVVYAEREAVRNADPIIENEHFRPDPERDILAHLPDTFRELMIQNGTLNRDGTINMETARRLGWDKEWEKRRQPAPQPIE